MIVLNKHSWPEGGFEFDQGPGQRLHRYFRSVCLDTDSPLLRGYWWSIEKRRWMPLDQIKGGGFSNHAPCKTFRAFKRMLRKNPHIVGHARLCSRYHDYDIWSV